MQPKEKKYADLGEVLRHLSQKDLQLIQNDLDHMQSSIEDIKKILNEFKDNFVTKEEFRLAMENFNLKISPIRMLTYGGVGMVMITVGTYIIQKTLG